MSEGINPPLTPFQRWLNTYATSLDDSHWAMQLWDSDRTSVDLPERCLVMQGFEDQLDDFKVTAVLVRREYLNLLNLIVALAKGHKCSPDDDTEMEDIEGQGFVGEASIPDNPFKSMEVVRQFLFVVSGSPGIGQSMFLHLPLGLRLNARIPTLLQLYPENAYLFIEHGVYILEGKGLSITAAQSLRKLVPNVWCLVDSDADMAIPSMFVRRTNFTIVQAPSPRTERTKWPKKIDAPTSILCMGPFTLEEAIIVHQFRLPTGETPTRRELQRWYQRYTPSVRTAYDHARSPSDYEDNLRAKLVNINAASFAELARGVQARAVPQNDTKPHEIFLYYPQSDHRLARSRITIPTDYLVSMVLQLFETTNAERRITCYRMWSGIKPMATVNGRLLEGLAMDFLPKGGTLGCSCGIYAPPHAILSLTARRLHLLHAISSLMARSLRLPFSRPTFVKFDTAVIGTSGFYIPVHDNQPMFDFVYIEGTKVVIFQCTAAESPHSVNELCLEQLQKGGINDVVFIGLVPSGNRPKFVINKEVACKFSFITGRYLVEFDHSRF
ncbi:hypothetical protein BS17DRAFT_882338 [Gyrodon lividus]|nr:hypothetical protein BS17DRAFT_882338 [Gyrodon lividus]